MNAWRDDNLQYRFQRENWGVPPDDWILAMGGIKDQKQLTEISKILGYLARAGFTLGQLRDTNIKELSIVCKSEDRAKLASVIFAKRD